MRDRLYRVWLAHRWKHFAVAAGGTLLIAALRFSVLDQVIGKFQLLFFTFAVAMAAFVGGLGPGICATGLSLFIGVEIFMRLEDKLEPPRPDVIEARTIQIVAFSVIWLFISIVCDIMRNNAIKYRRAAEESEESRDQIGSILSSISDAFYAVDRSAKIVHTNKAYRLMIGRDREQIEGQRLWDVFDPAEYAETKLQLETAMATNKPVAFDAFEPATDRWLHVRAFPNAHGLFVYLQDITDRKEADENRERLLAEEKKARGEAEQASRLKDEFVATVSHELRTPLTTILGWSEILAKKVQGKEELEVGVAAIERSTRLQAQLIEDLLDVSRIAAGKLQLELQIFEISEVIREAANGSLTAADIKNIRVELNLGDEEILVKGDYSRLTQVMSNLISNAVKFSPEDAKVEVTLKRSANMAVVSVTDHGVGIPADAIPIIFDRFRQANATITRRHGGLGLGLAIVKQLTDLHGGTVEAESEGPGQGSRFTVSLPITTPSRPLMSEDPVEEPPKSHRIDGVRVLVVDDDEGTRAMLSVILEDAGGVVHVASGAMEALDEMDEFKPDLLLSDIGMPDVDGYQLIQMVRQRSDDGIPAIALTAFAREEDRQRALRAGYNEHLTKPVDMDRLLAQIESLTSN